jgi:hypothetical protein
VAQKSTTQNLRRWQWVAPVAWPQWRAAPQLQGWFPAVLTLAALPWPTGKTPVDPALADHRRELGTAVLGALWRHLDPTAPGEPGTGPADAQQPPDPTELARQVAAAITAQAPTDPDHPGRYLGVGPSLTAALALAFLDQTLHTATTHTPHLTATIGTAHQAAAREFASLRHYNRLGRTSRQAWTAPLNRFVTAVTSTPTGPLIWTHLRHELRTEQPHLRSLRSEPAAAGPSARARAATAERLVSQEELKTATQLIEESGLDPATRQRILEANLKGWRRSTELFGWPSWDTAPHLQGRFPTVLALASLPLPAEQRQDDTNLATLRRELGTAVLGALRRHIDVPPTAPGEPGAGPGDTQQPPDPATLARQVAFAVTAQAPTKTDDPDHYLGVGPTLTGALALAFIDQTLHTATTHTPHLAQAIQSAHQAAAREFASLRNPNSRHQASRQAWTNHLVQFVSTVTHTPDGPQIWAHLLPTWLPTPQPETGLAQPTHTSAPTPTPRQRRGRGPHRHRPPTRPQKRPADPDPQAPAPPAIAASTHPAPCPHPGTETSPHPSPHQRTTHPTGRNIPTPASRHTAAGQPVHDHPGLAPPTPAAGHHRRSTAHHGRTGHRAGSCRRTSPPRARPPQAPQPKIGDQESR